MRSFAGQRRRLALASAFVRPRRLLVLDEPEARLDVEGVEWLGTKLVAEKAAGHAVLLHTGGDTGFGTPAYGVDAPHLTGDGAEWLADRKPALVGLDAVNIDALEDATRPAHTTLLRHGILVLEHLTNLAALPSTGARLHAAPVAWHGIGTWPVRAYAVHESTVDAREADQAVALRCPR